MIKRFGHLVTLILFVVIVSSLAFSLKQALYLSNGSNFSAAIKSGFEAVQKKILPSTKETDGGKETNNGTKKVPPSTLTVNGFGGGYSTFFDKKGKEFITSSKIKEPIEITGKKRNQPIRVILKLESNDEQTKQEIKTRFNTTEAAKHLPYVFAKMSVEQLENLSESQMEKVEWIEPDKPVVLHLNSSVPSVKDPIAWQQVEQQYGTTINGSGVKIAIIDSGVDSTHPDLAGRVVASAVFTGDTSTGDYIGHGTHVASIVAGNGAASNGLYKGMAPGASIISARVFKTGAPFESWESWVVLGIEWSVDQGASIINMSAGTEKDGGDGTDAMSTAANWAYDHGVLFVVSAGNAGFGVPSKVASPGVAAKALTVASSGDYGTFSGNNYSGTGPTLDGRLKPDVSAPGDSVTAARGVGTNFGTPPIPDNRFYTTISGTSMAAPHVAGLAALLKQAHPTWTAAQLKNAIIISAYDMYAINGGIGANNGAWRWGSGLIDPVKAVNTNIFFSNNGQVNYGFLSSTNASQNFTVQSGQGTLSENDPYLSVSPSSVTNGSNVTAGLSFPESLSQPFYDASITASTTNGIYRMTSFFSRAAKITIRVNTSNPNLASAQPFKILFVQGTPYSISGGGSHASETVTHALVAPGTYRVIVYLASVLKSDLTVEPSPFILTSDPITVSGWGQSVEYNFNLDQAYEIPFDLSAVGGVEYYQGGLKISPASSPTETAVTILSTQLPARLFINNTRPGDKIVVGMTTLDSKSAPTKSYLMTWLLQNITQQNHPTSLVTPANLLHFHATFSDPNPTYNRNISLSQTNLSTPFSIVGVPQNFSLDMYTNTENTYLSSISPRVQWRNSTLFTDVTPLPIFSTNQTIVVGPIDSSDITAPPAPAGAPSINIDENIDFDWPDVNDPSGVTYQISITNSNESKLFFSKMFLNSSNYAFTQGLSIGTYSVKVRAIDNKGNFGNWSSSSQFQIVDPLPGSTPGDVTGNGLVNTDDLLAVINAWGPCPGVCPADLTHNHLIDVDDLLFVINNWTS